MGPGSRCTASEKADRTRTGADRTLLVLPGRLDGVKRDQCRPGKSLCREADKGTGGQQPGQK